MMDLLRPSSVMMLTWTTFVAIYFALPFHYVHAPKGITWAVIIGSVIIFCFGASIAERAIVPLRSLIEDLSFSERAAIICAALGLFGIICIAIDKLLLSGVDWSQGISAVRERRSNEVMANLDIKRSALLYIGYFTFSFSCASYALFLLRGDLMSFTARWAGQLSTISMFVYALIYGGRTPILLVIIITVGAALVRSIERRGLLPKNNWMWVKLIILCAAFFAYTNYIWEARRTGGNVLEYTKFAQLAEERWEMRPSDWLDKEIRKGSIPNDLAMNGISLAMYLSHSPTTVQRMMEKKEELSLYGGLFQVGILSPLADKIVPSLHLPQKMRSELMKTGIYGWFPSAWGAWFADAGIALGAVCIFIWGLLCGLAFRLTQIRSSLGNQLLLIFAYVSILVSPINGPFGVANSFLIFVTFVFVASVDWFVRLRSTEGDQYAGA